MNFGPPMGDFQSWPRPPMNPEYCYHISNHSASDDHHSIHDDRPRVCTFPPEIPEEFMIFGVMYKRSKKNGDGTLRIDMPEQQLDVERLKGDIMQSFDNFQRLVFTMDPQYLDAISAIHARINENINLARGFYDSDILQECRNREIEQKLEIYRKIKKDTKRL